MSNSRSRTLSRSWLSRPSETDPARDSALIPRALKLAPYMVTIITVSRWSLPWPGRASGHCKGAPPTRALEPELSLPLSVACRAGFLGSGAESRGCWLGMARTRLRCCRRSDAWRPLPRRWALQLDNLPASEGHRFLAGLRSARHRNFGHLGHRDPDRAGCRLPSPGPPHLGMLRISMSSGTRCCRRSNEHLCLCRVLLS